MVRCSREPACPISSIAPGVLKPYRVGISPYVGRMGDMPALVLEELQAGLLIALHETTPDLITYKTWEKFARFAANQGFGDI